MSPNDTFFIKACVLSLASNVHPTLYLENAKIWLTSFGDLVLSPINSNQDKNLEKLIDKDKQGLGKKQLVPMTYFNQMAYLQFAKPHDYFEWVQLTKNFEQSQARDKFAKPQVSLDMDIVAIQLVDTSQSIQHSVDEKGDKLLLLADTVNPWFGIQRRFPLASYDKKGIDDLSTQLDLSFFTLH